MIEPIQEEKAILCKRLGDLVMRIPQGVASGSIQMVRSWKHERKKAASVLKDKRSSIPKLREVLTIMEQYK